MLELFLNLLLLLGCFIVLLGICLLGGLIYAIILSYKDMGND